MSETEVERPEKADWWDLNALWIWGFTLVVACIVVYQTVVYFRVEPGASEPATQIPWTLIAGWIVLLVMIFESLRQCCIEVVLAEDGQLRITRYYLHGAASEDITKASVTPAEVVATADRDGDPAFQARIHLPDKKYIVLCTDADRDECAAVCARFNEALARANG